MPQPTVSVIIVTYGREQVVVNTLNSVLDQLPEDGEIVLVDQTELHAPETDRQLAELEAAEPRLRIFQVDPPSTTAARNFGLAHTRGDVVVYFDDDVLLNPGCLQAHLSAHAAGPHVGGVVGRVEHPGQKLASSLFSMDDYGFEVGSFNWLGAGPVSTLNGANMSFKREAIESAGAFHTSYSGNAWREESDAAFRVQRAGWELRFVPEAHLVHLANPSGGARALGRNYYTMTHMYQNETLYFLRRFGPRRLPMLMLKLARRGVLRRSALHDRSVLKRTRALIGGTLAGLRLYRSPTVFTSTERG